MANYQEVTRVGFFDKIKGALAGIIVGPILIIVSVYMLWSNEFSYVAREKAIIKGESIVVEVDSKNPSSANNNNYVYTFGEVSSDAIQEPNFNFPINAVIASRIVEMYQWNEKSQTEVQENLGGSETHTTTYSYEKKWGQLAINSDDFNQAQDHQNPKTWQYDSKVEFAKNPKLGNFNVTDGLQAILPASTDLKLGEEVQNVLATGSTLTNNFIYTGVDYNNPQIGDLRISYKILPIGTTVSALAGQRNNDMLDVYLLDSGDNITKVEEGNKSAKVLFQGMKDDNSLTTWIMRVVFIILTFVGFSMLFSILPTLGSVVPFIGKIVGIGVGLIAFVGTLIVAGGTIAIAWFAARPIISIIIIAIIAGAIFAVKKLKSNKQKSQVGVS